MLDHAPDARGAQDTPSPKESMHRRPALSALLAPPVIWFSDPEDTSHTDQSLGMHPRTKQDRAA